MVTKRTRLMSAFAAILMLVSMFTAFVLPVSADAYSTDAGGYPNFPSTQEVDTYSASGYNHYLVSNEMDLNYVASNASKFTSAMTIHLATNIALTSGSAASKMGNQSVNIDGHGYAIRNCVITNSGTSNATGWIGTYSGTSIKNLVLEDWNAVSQGHNNGYFIYNFGTNSLTLENIVVKDCTLTQTGGTNGRGVLIYSINNDVNLTVKNIAFYGNTITTPAGATVVGNSGLIAARVDGGATINVDGVFAINNTFGVTGGSDVAFASNSNGVGLLFGECGNNNIDLTVKNAAVFGNTFNNGFESALNAVVAGRLKMVKKVTVDNLVTDVSTKPLINITREGGSGRVLTNVSVANAYTAATALIEDDDKGNQVSGYTTADNFTLANAAVDADVKDADTLAALNANDGADGDLWEVSATYAGYPIVSTIEANIVAANNLAESAVGADLEKAATVYNAYAPYKDGYAADFDLWVEGAAMKLAFDAAERIYGGKSTDVAADIAIIDANYKAFAETDGTVNLHLKNEYPYYPRLVDAAAYGPTLLAKYNAALNSNSGYDAVKTNPAADPRLDDDGHLNFRIGSAEEWISLVKNPANVNGYSLLATGAGSDDTVISGDGDCRVVFSLTNDIVFTTDGNTATDLSTLSNPTLVPTNTNFVFDGHNHVFKNVNMNINATGWNGGDRGLFYTGNNNVVYKNFGVASGTINVTGAASGGRLRISPLVAGTEGSLATMVNCWNAADVNVTATGFTSIYAAAIGNLARGNNNFVNCLNLGTITISDAAKATAGTAVYNAMATYNRTDYATQDYDNYSLFNCSSIAGGVASLVAGGQNKNGPDSASKFFDADATMGEIAYHMNANFHETAGILNNANNTTSHAAYSRLNLIRPYYTLVDGSVDYGTEATAVRKLTASLVDSNGDETSTKEYYYNGNLTVDAPAIEGYTPAAATVAMNAQDQTLVYNPEAGTVDLTKVNEIFAEWKKYDLKYFTEDSANAIEAVLDDAEALINETVTPTEQLVSELITAEAALDPKLNYTYPTYVPVDEYATYEKFGLQDADGIIYLAIDDAAALKFARDDAKFAGNVTSGGGFLSTVTDGAGTTYASKYGSGDADAASKANGDGKYRVRFVLTDDIDMTGYTFTGSSQWNANTAFLGYNHVISNVNIELNGSGSFFGGHNGYIADVGVQGSITTTDAAASIAPLSGFGGGNGHLRNCWFDIDLTGGAKRSAIASGANVPASNIVNVASFGTGANYVFETTTTTCGVKGIYYPNGVAFTSSGGAESGTTKLTATAGESGELAYLLNNADYSSNNAALGTYYYGDDYATKLATYYDVVDGKFAFSATNPEYCRIELLNTAGNKTLYAKKNTTITLNYAEGLECEYSVISGTSTLSGVNNDQLLVLDDTSITVTLTDIVTDVLEAAVAKYNGLNYAYFARKDTGATDLADQIAAANAIIDGTNEDAEQDDVNALATLIADGYQLDDYPNIPKVSEFDTYKDLGAVNFLVTDITELNALAGKKASFTKDYTVHFAENVVIVVGAEDAAKNMSGMNANIDGHGATIKGVTFSLTAADGTAAWLGVYGGSKISNLVLDSWNTTFTGWKSGVLIANSNVALTLENITIKDCTASYVGNYGGFLLADYNGSALTLTNITVEGSTMTHAAGNNGLLVGRVNSGTLTAENLYLNGNTITHTTGTAGGRGVVFGEENATTATISNVIVLNTTFGEGHVYTSGNVRMGVIVGRHKVNALTVRNAIVVLGDYKNQDLPIINCDGIDGNTLNAPTSTLENIYSDAKYENYVTGTTEKTYTLVDNSNVIDTAKLLSGYATNALNLAGADIWTMVGNATDGYEPAFITGSEKATVAVSFASDSWLAGEGGLTYTYYTDSTGKLIGVDPADVVALKKVDNWDDLDAAVLATYDAATTISGTYEGEEHTHSFATLTPNDDGETHTGENCTAENCPWYDEAIECTFNQYAHNGNPTYDGSAHSASCLCGNAKGEPEACKDDATLVTSDPAECDNPGSETYLCNKCGETFVKDIPALEHEYDDNDWTPDAEKGYHTHECINGCGTSEREQCNYVESGRTNAQVGVPGEIQYTCSKCGDTKTEPIPAQMGLVLTASGAAYVGRTVSVKTELAGNPGLRGLAVSYGYDASIYTYTDAVYGNIPGEDVRWEVSQPSAPDGDGYTWITITFTTTADSGFTGEEVMTVNFTVADEVNASESYIYAKVEAEGAVNTENEFVDVPGTHIEIPVSEVLFGDFYANGEVNLIDVVMMLRYTVGKADVLEKVTNGECSLDAFDVNDDGDYTVDDVLIVLKEVNDRLNNQAAGK